MKPFIMFIVFFGQVGFAFSQQVKSKAFEKEDTATLHIREVVISMDTTIEYNNVAKGYNISDFLKIDKGLKIHATDNVFRIISFSEIANNELNGIYMEFYLPSNLPKVRGVYKDNVKEGGWFYWSETGNLLKKETWKSGKLIRTVNMKKP